MSDNLNQTDQRVQEEIDVFKIGHEQIMLAFHALEAATTPEQIDLCAHLRDAILNAYRDTRLMAALLEELAEYNRRLLAQRQTSRSLFLAGGEAVIADLLALATGPAYVQLRQLLEQMAQHDEIHI